MISYLISALAGLLMQLSFNPNSWPLALLALALLIRLLGQYSRRKRFKLVFLFSITYFLGHLTWVQLIGHDAWILLSLVAALPWLVLAINPVNYRSFRSLVLFASTVVVIEVLRSHLPYGGFPWGLIAFSQIDGPLIYLAQIGGQALVTFCAVLVAGLFLRTFSLRITSSLFLIGVIFFIGSRPMTFDSIDKFNVVAIQGNVPRLGLDQFAQRYQVFNNHVLVTQNFLASNDYADIDLIVWPESSTDIDPLLDTEVGGKIDSLTKSSKIPILVGATIEGTNPDGPRGSGILWQANGQKDFYIKNHLVPFGEYIPHRNLLNTFIDRIQLVPRDYVPGTEIGLFQLGQIKFGDVICYEVVFGDTVRHLVADGAKFLVIQTNNATYGNTSQPEQQFQISRFRAIEHKRSVVIASTSGISGLINPDGQVVSKTEQFVPAIVKANVELVDDKTFNDRYPRWTAILSSLFVAISLAISIFRRRIA